MDVKKFFVPALILVMLAGFANATVTATINTPTSGQMFYPNIGDPYMDINIQVIDDNALNSIHTVTADYNLVQHGFDVNRTMATDLNLSSANCVFATINDWSTPGATCKFRFTFPNPRPPTGNYSLDVNVVGSLVYANGHQYDHATTPFSIDNRFVSAATEALMNIIPIVLIAAVLVGLVLVGFGAMSGKTLLILAVGAIVAVIATVVYSGVLAILTP